MSSLGDGGKARTGVPLYASGESLGTGEGGSSWFDSGSIIRIEKCLRGRRRAVGRFQSVSILVVTLYLGSMSPRPFDRLPQPSQISRGRKDPCYLVKVLAVAILRDGKSITSLTVVSYRHRLVSLYSMVTESSSTSRIVECCHLRLVNVQASI